MTGILISVILGLLVNECCDISPWCARKLVEWSAYRRYADPDRAAVRAEEWAALIDARPGKLLKLLSALGFAGSAILVVCRRTLARPMSLRRERKLLLEQNRQLVLQQNILSLDAEITTRLMENIQPVIQALQPTKEAMIRIGAMLIIKENWSVCVYQLTASQQAMLDHRPSLLKSPHDIEALLDPPIE